jgi:ABC-type phosphate transport system permease subunit
MVAQAATHEALRAKGHGASLVLVVMFLSMSILALLIRNRYLKKLSG